MRHVIAGQVNRSYAHKAHVTSGTNSMTDSPVLNNATGAGHRVAWDRVSVVKVFELFVEH